MANHSRPDLAFSVTRLKRVLRFLKYSRDWKLVFSRSNSDEVIGYSDADFANSRDRKSTTGFCFIMNEGAISWKTKKQGLVTTSTCESEYVALGVATREALWIRKLETELIGAPTRPMVIYEDNESTIRVAHNEGSTGRTKHIDLQLHFVRDRIRSRDIEVRHMPTAMMTADILTKQLSKAVYERHARGLGLRWND